MAERIKSSGAGDLNFIDSNPTTDAFQAGMKAADEQFTRQLVNEHQIVSNAEQLKGAPTRLRTLEANADLTRANADVGMGTVGSKIATEANNARRTGAEADVAVGSAPYKIDDAYQTNRTNASNADVNVATVPSRIESSNAAAKTATAGADVAAASVPADITQRQNTSRLSTVSANVAEKTEGNQVRTSNANTAKLEMEGFLKSLDLLNAGQTEAAQQVATAYGSEIPQAIIDNAEARAAVTQAAKYATETYPNRPLDQQMFMKGYLKDMADRKAKGEQPNNPQAPYNVPGAPEPQEDTNRSYFEWVEGKGPDPADPTKMVDGTWKLDRYGGTKEFTPGESISSRPAGRGGVTKDPAQVATAKWLVEKGVAANEQEAWTMVTTSKSNPGSVRAQVFNAAMRASFGNTAKANQAVAEWDKINAAGAAPPTTAGGATRPPAGLSGSGTKEAPFQATTQDHINWFKQNAQPGQVIVINGTPYTK